MATIQSTGDDTAFIGHPKGLGYIVFTEAWERFSFYGMQALMMLYMSTYLFLDGNFQQVIGFDLYESSVKAVFGELSTIALAAQTFGIYIGLVYFMPVFGGLLGDRVLGQRKAVLLGAFAMAIGHFLMAFEPLFFFAMAALIVGSGLLKGNLAAQVGALYEQTDQRRDTAYSIYNIAINVGAFIAPLVCGTLGELVGWHYGFGAAGIGMMVGIVIYVVGAKHLPDIPKAASDTSTVKMHSGDVQKIMMLVVLILISSLYWVAQTQVWTVYPLWIKDHVDLTVGSFTMPITWFQSIDFLAVIPIAILAMWRWHKQRLAGNEPKDFNKIMLGCAIFALANAWLATGQFLSGDGKVAIYWPVFFHFICAVGFLYAWPAVMAMISRTAPASVNSMMVGSCYLAIFIGSSVSGWLGRFYETMSPETFWLMHAAIVFGATIAIAVLKKPLTNILENGK